MRPGAVGGAAHRRPGGAGRRRRAGRAADPGTDHRGLPARAPRRRHRSVGRLDRARSRDRPAGRRGDRAGTGLAVGVLGQRPDRPRPGAPGPALAGREPRTGPTARPGRARAGRRRGDLPGRRPAARPTDRVGLGRSRDPARRSRRARSRVLGMGTPQLGADAAARDVHPPRVGRGAGRAGRAGRQPVRRGVPGAPIPAAGPRRQPADRRAGPAALDRPDRRDRAPRRAPRRPARRTPPHHHRTGRPGRCVRAARPGHDLHRRLPDPARAAAAGRDRLRAGLSHHRPTARRGPRRRHRGRGVHQRQQLHQSHQHHRRLAPGPARPRRAGRSWRRGRPGHPHTSAAVAPLADAAPTTPTAAAALPAASPAASTAS